MSTPSPPTPRKVVPGEIPGGPKPVVWRGMVVNSKIVVFYSFLFTVPAFLTFLYTGGRTQLSREDLMKSEAYQAKMREKYGEESEIRQKEMKEAMNKVLFETKGTLGKPDWAIKRDQERERRRQQEELRRQQEKQD